MLKNKQGFSKKDAKIKAKEIDRRICEIISAENNKSKSDPLGSYTGVARDAREKPVQDADDL